MNDGKTPKEQVHRALLAAGCLCEICQASAAANKLPTLAHLRQDNCQANFVWASDIDLFLEIVRAERRRRMELFQKASGQRAEELSEIDKARVLDLVKLAASSHADFADLSEKVRSHFLFHDLLKDE